MKLHPDYCLRDLNNDIKTVFVFHALYTYTLLYIRSLYDWRTTPQDVFSLTLPIDETYLQLLLGRQLYLRCFIWLDEFTFTVTFGIMIMFCVFGIMGTVIVPVQWRHIIRSCCIQHKKRSIMLKSASGLPASKEDSLSISARITSIIIASKHFPIINPSLAFCFLFFC